MNKEQKKILGMAMELHNICRKYEIKHYLVCGSCLGAIRNQGFIPWDDDIDFVMTREGIEKLRDIFCTHDFKNRVLVGKGIVDGYHEEPYRYISTTDTSIQRSTMHYDCPLGTYVDILVLDPMPKREKERKKYEKKMGIYFELSNNVYTTQPQGYRYSPKKYVIYKKLERFLGKDFFLKKIQKYLRSFSEEECDYYAASWQGTFTLSFSKKLFGAMRMVPFEDQMLPVPEKAETFLRECYGDDWMLEPENESAHIIVSDSDIPYTIYYNDYMRFIDENKWIKLQYDKKIVENELLPLRQTENTAVLNADGLRVRMILEDMIEKSGIDLKQCLEERRYSVILELFQEYIERQFGHKGKGFIYWKKFLELPDDMLYPVWYALCMRGWIYEVQRIMQWRKEQGSTTLSEELSCLEKIIEGVVRCSRIFYEEKDWKKASHESEILLSQSPDIPELQFIKYSWKVSESEEQHVSALEEEIVKCLEEWPENGMLRKCLADVQFECGKHELAKENYQKSLLETRNGVVRSECRRRLAQLQQ